MSRLRSWLAAVALAALLAAGPGCLTPSVPIPPPEATYISFEVDPAAGEARFSYAADPSFAHAVVYVFNRSQGVGVIDTANEIGQVGPTAPFPASEGDEIVVSFELDTQLASICVRLRAGPSDPSRECGQ